jgi:hypothetical protein
MEDDKVCAQLVGEAGVHYVISEFAQRGMIAVATSRNVKRPDVIVTNPDGTRFAAIQVKTRRNTGNKFWTVGDKGTTWGGPNCWYVFVKINHGKIEAFMEKASRVKEYAKANIRERTRKGKKSFGAGWGYGLYFVRLMKDANIEKRSRRQWQDFNL